jgi:hypothetical protein
MALTKATGEPAASCTAPGIPATPCTSRSKNLAAQSPSSKINTETVRHRLTHTLLRWCLHVGHCHPLLWLRDGTHPLAARTSEPRPLAQVRQIRPAAPVGAKTWARPTSRSQDSPSSAGRFGRQAGTQAPDGTSAPGENHGSRAGSRPAGPGSTIHILPAEYKRMNVTPSSLQLGCRTPHYAQLLRPPCARFGVLGSWRYGGLPVVIPGPDKAQAVEAAHAQLSMIDQAQPAPKRCCRGRLPRRSIVPLPVAASRHPTAAACQAAAGEEDGAGQDWSEPMGSRDRDQYLPSGRRRRAWVISR